MSTSYPLPQTGPNKRKMTATMSSGVTTFLFVLVAALNSIHVCYAFYLPGVNPQSFAEGDP
jgi:hypothetical protein